MKKYLLLFVLFVSYCANAQVTKVVFSSLGNAAVDAKNQAAFSAGFAKKNGAVFSGTIVTMADGIANMVATFDYASANGFQVVIRSTNGLDNVIATAPSYPSVLVFMPAGSNTYQSEYTGDVTTCPVVVTGSGIAHNNTAYFVEFFAPNPLTGGDAGDISSYSNAYIAGQMCFLANDLGKTIQEIRLQCRSNGKPLPLNNDGWNDGYGLIDISSAMPVELVSFVAKANVGGVLLSWKTATEVNNFGFEVERRAGNSWEKVGFIPGNGTTNTPKEYSFSDKSAVSGKAIYRLKQIDRDGKFEYSKECAVEALTPPTKASLGQNFPNPFNPATVISFTLPENSFVTLKVYDMLGREVENLVNEEKSAGTHQVKFDGSHLSSGMYMYRLSAGKFSEIKTMILTK